MLLVLAACGTSAVRFSFTTRALVLRWLAFKHSYGGPRELLKSRCGDKTRLVFWLWLGCGCMLRDGGACDTSAVRFSFTIRALVLRWLAVRSHGNLQAIILSIFIKKKRYSCGVLRIEYFFIFFYLFHWFYSVF